MLEQLQHVFREVFKNDALIITESTSAKDIKMWDSLTHLELIAAVETAFSIKFTFNDVMMFSNVGEMMALVEKKTKS